MEMSPASARMLTGMLEQRTGQQIGPGRAWRMELALKQLMREQRLDSLDAVASRVAGGRDPRLADAVIEALLNNETSFFRDAGMFQLLAEAALPRLITARAETRRLRIWSAGCSTGQEAFSLAMTVIDDPRLAGWAIDIVATDVSRGAIDQARSGRYSQLEIQRGLPVRLMMRWFEREGASDWIARPALRDRVRFHVHSLLDAAPLPARFDLVLCRNVLLYFDSATRRRVFDRLAGAIAPDGVLMLGAGETVIGQTERFASDPDLRGLYRRAAS
ncbi:protein-glutamate O-methyltransferase CheR [Sphingomonas sp. 1P06PA]|uniref:CheR family methyltransferase n=1 Tax=Sphingomonas sp. 1P06PA TaxID=554121 RepID=UPI0039A543B8